MGDQLNPRQEAFCREYVVDWNGNQAAIRAGYSKKTAAQHASRLLTDVKIKKEISRLCELDKEEIAQRRRRLIQHLERIAYSKVTNFASFNQSGIDIKDSEDCDDDLLESLNSISMRMNGTSGDITMSVKLKSGDKARELLARHYGVIKDSLELTGEDGGPIRIQNEVRQKMLTDPKSQAALRELINRQNQLEKGE